MHALFLGLLIAVSLLAAPRLIAADEPSALDILHQASVRLAETPTIRFDLSVEGDTYIDTARTLKLLDAEGDLVRPDRVRTAFKVEALGRATITVNLIIIGDQWWTTDLISGKWGPAPVEFEYDPSELFDLDNGIGPVMSRVTDAERLDDEEIDDRDAFHVRALVDGETIGPLTAFTLEGSPVTVDLWIDRETFDLLRARLAEPEPPVNATPGATDASDAPAVWTLDFFDHGAEFTIDPPV